MKKNEIRLYNLILPLWLLIFMPPAVLVTIPVNFAVDSAVLLLAAHFVCPDFGKELWKKCILRVFIFQPPFKLRFRRAHRLRRSFSRGAHLYFRPFYKP